MPIKDAQIIRLIERIGEHYRANISNRFIRPALLQLPIDKQSWDLVECLTEKVEQYQYQGYHMDEVYLQIAAASRFISITRKETAAGLRVRLSSISGGSDRVLTDMAINNFTSNLQVFADLINELYVSLVDLDKQGAKGKKPMYLSIPELRGIGHLLVGA